MSIEQTNIIDVISLDEKTNTVVLTISDHINWENEIKGHLLLLQEKINSYLRFIESGEIYSSYPDARGRDVVIEIVGKFSLIKEAKDFLENAVNIVENAGFKLRFVMLEAEK